jgi:heme o synthase
LYTQVNPLASALAAGNILLYSLVYTPLKRVTPLNTEVGAVVGAIPPLIGWAASTGGLSLGALSVAYCLYAWQMPHFLSLSWNLREDYARGGYKMLANVRPDLVPRASFAYSLSLLPVGLFAYLSGVCTLPCVFTAGAAALPMVYYGYRFHGSHSKADARKLFRCSLFYLPLALCAMIAHRVPSHDENDEQQQQQQYQQTDAHPVSPSNTHTQESTPQRERAPSH